MCPICKVAKEDIWHVLWSCTASVAVWQEGSRQVQKLALEESDGLGLFQQWRERLEDDELLVVLTAARLLWLRRNFMVFDRGFTPLAILMRQAQEAMAGYAETLAPACQNNQGEQQVI